MASPQALPDLRGQEIGLAVGAVGAAYGAALLALHRFVVAFFPGEAAAAKGVAAGGFWGTLPSVWDHPEPNYRMSDAIGEFWSVLTTIPVAGTMLMYVGLRFSYSSKVLSIYTFTCAMYSLAFVSHLTLQPAIFSTTVIAVMSNALLTFGLFSHVVHRALHHVLIRGSVVVASEALLVGTVVTLPYALSANGYHGGVWTLFIVQAPGVFLATALATAMALRAVSAKEKTTYGLVSKSGCLLSSAMVLSLVECLIGFEHGFVSKLWGFPWLHIAIHVFEQVGIYLFGVGVAALEALLLQPAREGADVRHVGGWLPYLYCSHPLRAAVAPTDADKAAVARIGADAADVLVDSEVVKASPGAAVAPSPSAAASAAGAADDERVGRPVDGSLGGKTGACAVQRRSRVQSPGVTAPKAPAS